jgi:GNAT superfamily N-acetyltransferase
MDSSGREPTDIKAGERPSRPHTLVRTHVREVHDHERAWLAATLQKRWNGDTVAGRGRTWTPRELPALVAVEESGERVGLATYEVAGETAELVTIDALRPGGGVGRRLLEAVAAAARAAGARPLSVMTTNDNLPALRLYQHAGLRLAELRPGAVDRARTLKPSIPVTGHDGIPIRDELDLILDLDRRPNPRTASRRTPGQPTAARGPRTSGRSQRPADDHYERASGRTEGRSMRLHATAGLSRERA